MSDEWSDFKPVSTGQGDEWSGFKPVSGAAPEPDAPPETPGAKSAREFAETRPRGNPATDAFVRGATLGWAPELSADLGAAMAGMKRSIKGAMGEDVSHDPTFSETRSAELSSARKREAEYQKSSPIKNAIAELAGGMVIPGMGSAGSFIGKGATAFTKAARAGIVGAGYGAVAGASDESDRAGGSESGALYGGLTGGALHLFGSAVKAGLPAAAKAIGSSAVEFWQRATSVFGVDKPGITPEEHTKALGDALEYVHRVAQAINKTPADLRATPEVLKQKGITAAEALGPAGTAQLGAAGRRLGQTGEALENRLNERKAGTADRIYKDLQDVTGVDPVSLHGDFQEMTDALRAKTKPLYDVAYFSDDGTPTIADSPKLRDLMRRPAVKEALKRAASIMEEEGHNPYDMRRGFGLKIVPVNGAELGSHNVVERERVQIDTPFVQTWDYVKHGLDDVLDTYRDKTTGRLNLDNMGRSVLGTLNDLKSELYAISREYKNAVAHGGDPIVLEEAYRRAPQLMRPGVTMAEFNKAIENYTPAQMEALRGGYITSVYNELQRRALTPKGIDSPLFQQKLDIVLGHSNSAKFLDRLKAEADLARSGQRMAPRTNSITGETMAAMEDQSKGAEIAGKFVARTVSQGVTRGVIGVLSDIAKTGVAPSQMPVTLAMRDEIGRLLQLPPDRLADALEAHIQQSGQPSTVKGQWDRLRRDPRAVAGIRRAMMALANQAAIPNPAHITRQLGLHPQ